jgi:hypothetical protein
MRRLPKTSPTLSVLLIIPLTIKSDQPTALMAACQSNGVADLVWVNPQAHDHRWKFSLAMAWNEGIGPPRYYHEIDWLDRETGSTNLIPMMDEWDETWSWQ